LSHSTGDGSQPGRWRAGGAPIFRWGFLLLLLALFTTRIALSQFDHHTYLPLVSRNDFGFQVTWATVSRVIDGDTVELSTGQKVRYLGIDTPELTYPRECYALEAYQKNRELVEGKRVALRKDVSETDRYGRLLRYVYLPNGEMVNAILVREGYALAATIPPDVMFADLFVRLEREAREAGRGLWGPACQATPTPTHVPPSTVGINGPCSQFDAPGNDHYNLNEEWVCFTNYGDAATDMTDWRVEDEVGHFYIFPSFTLPAGATVRLHTGSGENTQTDLYWGWSRAIWNNTGDTVYLYDAFGDLVDRYSY
jgi:endonuclease YncB( thermonuclease family)